VVTCLVLGVAMADPPPLSEKRGESCCVRWWMGALGAKAVAVVVTARQRSVLRGAIFVDDILLYFSSSIY